MRFNRQDGDLRNLATGNNLGSLDERQVKEDAEKIREYYQKTGYNQILFNPFFSPDGKHVAYFASQYVGGDMHDVAEP